MANRRDAKRNINHLMGDVIEEYYNAFLSGDSRLDEAQIEALVDDCVDLADDLISKVNSTKKFKTRAEVKKHYSQINEKLGEGVIKFLAKSKEI
jgi:hypothetical protein